MKTALELLGDDRQYDGACPPDEAGECALCKAHIADLELVARRAREEMRDMAEAVCNECDWSVAAAYKIADLPVTP